MGATIPIDDVGEPEQSGGTFGKPRRDWQHQISRSIHHDRVGAGYQSSEQAYSNQVQDDGKRIVAERSINIVGDGREARA